jgi:eukaryotic-like serine/threonine-protein kinase
VIGSVLNERWRIDAKLADGGMSTLWVASPVAGGAKVAVKVLSRELGDDPSIRQRFLREAQLVNSIDHPGVVPVIEGGVTPLGQPYMVMELLEGATVADQQEQAGGRLPYGEVVRLGVQMLDVLAVAHAKGIVHRDIKPENLFVEKGGRLRVLDFGLGKAMQLYGDAASTAVGTIIGTPEFMAPERAMGKVDIDARADLWAAGATLFKLASGDAVHQGETAIDVLMAAATTPARSLASVVPDAPSALVTAVDRALKFDPPSRWPNATEMRAAMQAGSGAWNDTTAAMPEPSTSTSPDAPKPAAQPDRQDKTLMMSRPEDVAAMRAAAMAAAARADAAPLSQPRPPYASSPEGFAPSNPRPPMGSVPDASHAPPPSQARPPMGSMSDHAPTSQPRPPMASWSGSNAPASQQWGPQGDAPPPQKSRALLVAGIVVIVVSAVGVGLVAAHVL